jgi:intein/homing endonuclease
MLETPVKRRVPKASKSRGENHADRDNQQGTCLSTVEKAWLAGFLDADGMIRMHKGQKNSRPGQKSLSARVSFINTCGITIKRVVDLLGRMGIDRGLSVRPKSKNPEWATGFDINVTGQNLCRILLTTLMPYLVTKKLEAQILLAFIERRQATEARRRPYVTDDYLAFAALSFIKKTRHLRDYMPTIEEIFNQDIVRSSAKALEALETGARLTDEQKAEKGRRLVQHRWNPKDASAVDFDSLKSSK